LIFLAFSSNLGGAPYIKVRLKVRKLRVFFQNSSKCLLLCQQLSLSSALIVSGYAQVTIRNLWSKSAKITTGDCPLVTALPFSVHTDRTVGRNSRHTVDNNWTQQDFIQINVLKAPILLRHNCLIQFDWVYELILTNVSVT
jgi:hypothetical protein